MPGKYAVIMCRCLASFMLCLLSFAIPAEPYYVFIGSYNWHKRRPGLYVYQLDTLTGALSKMCAVKGLQNPAFLTLSADGRYLYACTEAHMEGGGTVSAFVFDENKGSLTYINQQKSGGENPVYLTVHNHGKWLVNANYTGGSVAVFALGAHGEIQPASQVVAFTDSGINRDRQDPSHIHAAVFSPTQDSIYFPDLGADKIRCFAFDPSNNMPLAERSMSAVACTPGSGPRHLVFHPSGFFAYCTEEMGGAITSYRYHMGRFDSMQRIFTHEPERAGPFSNADIHISPDGRFLYASNRGKENSITIFLIDQQNGRLALVGYQPTLGHHPRNFAIDPSGRFLLVANQISGDVVVFKRNMRTGALSPTGNKIKIRGASCVQIRQYGE